MQAGEIKVVLTLDNGQFTIQTQKAGETIQELKRSLDQTAASSQRLEQHFTGLYTKFHDTVRTASLLRFAMQDIHDLFLALPSAIMKSSGEMERLTTLMQGMSKATDDYAKKMEAASNVKYVFGLAQNAPFEIKSLTDAFVKFKSAGLDPTNGSLKGLIDSVARFGGTSETLHRASIAIQQMAGKGVISMEELRQQLGEAVPNAINMMAEGAGMSVQKFATLVKSGTVEANASLSNMFTIMQIENKGASEAMMDTWVGLLALLKTKFELFKVEAGGAGAFNAAKDAVRELIEAFDTLEARSVASALGKGLADVINGIRDAINFMVKYGEEIKTAGEILLLYWGATKLNALMDGVKGVFKTRMDMYDKEIAKAESNNNLRANLMAQEVADRRVIIKDLNAQASAQFRLAESMEAIARASAAELAEAKRLAGGRGAYSQEEFNRIAARAAQDRQAINNAREEGAALAQKAQQLERVAGAHERMAASVRAGLSVASSDLQIIQETNLHAQKTVGILDEKAKAAGRATSGVTGLQTAMAGMQTIVGLFGGWINVALVTLGYLADKLYEFLNRWKEAEEIQKRIKQGLASDQDATKLATRIGEKNREIAFLESVESRKRPEMGTNDPLSTVGRRILEDQKFYDTQLLKLQKAREDRDSMIKSLQDQTVIMDKAAMDLEGTAYRRKVESEVAKMFASDNAKIKELEQKIQDKRDEVVRAGGNTVQAEKAAADERAQIIGIRQQSTRKQLDFLKNERTQLEAALDAATGEDAKNKIQARLDVLSNEREGLIKKAADLADQALKLGTIKVIKKPEPDKPEDPLIRYVETLENNLAKAQLRLDANIKGVRDLVQFRNEAAVQVLGDMAEGKFDKPIGKDADDVARRKYVGDQIARREAVKNFLKTLQDGQGDVEGFVKGLKTLDDEQKSFVLRAIDAAGKLPVVKEELKALEDAQRQSAMATEYANAALVKLNSNGLTQMSSGMLAMMKHFAALETRLKSVGGDFKAFNEEKAKAFAQQTIGDARNAAAEQDKASRAQMEANVKAMETATQAREAEHQRKLREIDEFERYQSASIERLLAKEEVSLEEQALLTEALRRVQVAAANARGIEEQRNYNASNAAMLNLKKNWTDSVEAMKNLTVSWSNQFLDYLAQVTTGSSGMWKQMVRGMAMDLYKVLLKDQVGGLITNMFGSLGNTLTSALQLSGGTKRGENPATPMFVKDVSMGAEENTFKEVKDQLNDTWTTLKEKMSEMYDSLKDTLSNVFSSLSDNMSSIWDSLSGAMSGMSGDGGGWTDLIGSFFADGGVMTGKGSVALKKYAAGGVANSPQLAMFGEGATPEAYVPLADGRSIPVTMSSTSNTQGNVQINITVNKSGDDTTTTSGDDAETWKRVAGRVRGVVMEELVVQQRPGGVLYR